MTSAEAIVVVAHWRTDQSSLGTVDELLPELRERSLAETGCIGYEILRGREDPTSIVLIERYRDEEALKAHSRSTHYQDLVVGRIRPLLTDRTVEILEPHR
jgi:quinol monooxygenase YgiN